MVNTGLSASGESNVYNRFGNVDAIIDVVGYYDHHTHNDVDSEAAIDVNDTARDLTDSPKTVTTVTVAVPTSGYVIVNSSVSISAIAGDVTVRCSITRRDTVDTIRQLQTAPDLDAAQMGAPEASRSTRGCSSAANSPATSSATATYRPSSSTHSSRRSSCPTRTHSRGRSCRAVTKVA